MVAPRTVTLSVDGIPLNKALADLSKQTGISVSDRRRLKDDSKLTLDLNQSPFWPAVDAIARQVKAGVSAHQVDGGVALVSPPPNELRVSYSGVFRTAARRLALSRDLETGTRACTLTLEIAWEPWFRPFLLEVKSYDGEFAPDGTGKSLKVKRAGTGQVPVHGRSAIELELPLPAPERSSAALTRLSGNLSVIGPTKMHAVRFSGLGGKSKVRPQVPEEGITVSLRRFTVVDQDLWEVEIGLAYPPGAPKLESFQSWLVNNRIYLEKGKGAGRIRFHPRPADERIVSMTPNKVDKAVIQYRFVEEAGKTPRLGNPRDWTLVYETPGRIIEVPATFELKDLTLP
jgi:hypothetical protein